MARRKAAAPEPTPPASPDAKPWPAETVERWAIDRVTPYDKNPNTHSPAQIAQIVASMKEFGWTMPVLVDEGGMLIAGHGRLEAAKQIGLPEVPVMVARGWTDAQKRAYVIADNKIAANSEWDDALLRAELTDLKDAGFDLGITGFDDAELVDLLTLDTFRAGDQDDDGEEEGRLLERANITIAEPQHQVEAGDHYILGGRHHLVVASVIAGHEHWSHLLVPGTVFTPFPGPFVPFGKKAKEAVIVMVQPDPYLAGHLLDLFASSYGAASVVKQAPALAEAAE
jgi:ParB-like nuclease domain